MKESQTMTQPATETPAAMPEKIVNGMSVTRLMETIEAIQKDPGIADFKFRVRTICPMDSNFAAD